jgi:hypothetical protein
MVQRTILIAHRVAYFNVGGEGEEREREKQKERIVVFRSLGDNL